MFSKNRFLASCLLTKTSKQMECEVELLNDNIQMAKAKLQSLEEVLPPRPWYGKANFTCNNCHYKGHKVTKPCNLPTCRGYNECGVYTMGMWCFSHASGPQSGDQQGQTGIENPDQKTQRKKRTKKNRLISRKGEQGRIFLASCDHGFWRAIQ